MTNDERSFSERLEEFRNVFRDGSHISSKPKWQPGQKLFWKAAKGPHGEDRACVFCCWNLSGRSAMVVFVERDGRLSAKARAIPTVYLKERKT